MNILVTGATGFIGRHLVPTLFKKGWSVRCLARTTSVQPEEFRYRAEWVIGDLQDLDSLKEACKNIDLVIHLAGTIKANAIDDFYSINAGGTRNLLEAILQSGNSNAKFILISSQAALGPASNQRPLTEDDKPRPVSNYGKSKLEAEKIILEYRNLIRSIIIRPSVVYGPGDRESLSLFRLAGHHINPHIGFKSTYINSIHVQDLVQLIHLSIENNVTSGEIFNANDGMDRGYSTEDVIKCAARSLGTWTIPIYIPKTILKMLALISSGISKISGDASMINPDKYRELSARYWIFSSQKARSVLGFSAQYDLNTGFQMTADWYREQQWL